MLFITSPVHHHPVDWTTALFVFEMVMVAWCHHVLNCAAWCHHTYEYSESLFLKLGWWGKIDPWVFIKKKEFSTDLENPSPYFTGEGIFSSTSFIIRSHEESNLDLLVATIPQSPLALEDLWLSHCSSQICSLSHCSSQVCMKAVKMVQVSLLYCNVIPARTHSVWLWL
jgi:hypothetical protein